MTPTETCRRAVLLAASSGLGLLAGCSRLGGSSPAPGGTNAPPTEPPAWTRSPEPTTTGEPRRTTAGGGTTTAAPIDRGALERAVHRRVNEVRASRELSELAFDTDLREIARFHSVDMAEADYFAHESPDGGMPADRYDRFGYDCRVHIGDDRYLTAG